MRKLLGLIGFLSFLSTTAQEQPKVVVGIVVDQMRQEYLTRYWDRFSDSGFKRLINEGFRYDNCQYDYIPTLTGPGHASIYTGTTPAFHGIVANDWYDRQYGDMLYCAQDDGAKVLGGMGKGMSPKNMQSTTITDQLALYTQFQSKVIGISIKDRGAILPAGHSAQGAYWYDAQSGKLVGSNWYEDQLPQWVLDFNKRNLAMHYLDGNWETLYPINTYTTSAPDSNAYEYQLISGQPPEFPYDLKRIRKDKGYKLLALTPFGNSFVTQAALSALSEEELGHDAITDFLCISYSSTDYAGHYFGPQSVEVEDMYLRLDQEIAQLLKALDDQVGKGAYTVFLTADHGANDVPALMHDHKMPGGLLKTDSLEQVIKKWLFTQYADSSLLLKLSNEQVYLDHVKLKQLKLSVHEVAAKLGKRLSDFPGILKTYDATKLQQIPRSTGHKLDDMMYMGYQEQRSGDLIMLTAPGWMDYGAKGTTHGSGFSYDTRVPLLFFGSGIQHGRSSSEVYITDIAPTICQLLGIGFPNATIGKPLQGALGY